ncbi:MAG: hypothetical protein ACTHMT_07980 [Verrucomicrobiota bacterium]
MANARNGWGALLELNGTDIGIPEIFGGMCGIARVLSGICGMRLE